MDDSKAINTILSSKLLDADFYQHKYSVTASTSLDLVENYFYFGTSQGYNPNPYFDTNWYLNSNPDVKKSKINPLTHYILYGEKEGRSPHPYFDPIWYKKHYNLRFRIKTVLHHYLNKGRKKRLTPLPLIDVAYYLRQNPDVTESNTDPVKHFIEIGCLEGRLPHPKHSDNLQLAQDYIQQRDDLPFAKKLTQLLEKHVQPHNQNSTFSNHKIQVQRTSLATEIRKNAAPSEFYEEFDASIAQRNNPVAKVVAFYLPQFYAFEENNQWWGKGFTEWTNVAKGIPRFSGHYQPRIPKDLGFYNLTSESTIEEQIKLALGAGLHGFCYYYYWFNQKRMLDKPLDIFVEMDNNDFPFCLMWANENWTRSWDGLNKDILMHQDYRDEDEDALLKDLARYFSRPNYIKVNDRPLFIIYRPSLIPDSKETFSRWRKKWKDDYQTEPYMLMVQGFNDNDPAPHGLDGAIEFPPHKLSHNSPHIPYEELNIFDPDFSGAVVPYDTLVTNSLSEKPPEHPLIKSVTPSWDNDARREGHGYTITGSTPKKYKDWLSGVIDYSQKNPFNNESFVFVNAWNEWAEGAYLEPDIHFGSAYLNATARAIAGEENAITKKLKILLVGHDAHPHGAQMLLINIAKTIKHQFGLEVSILLLEGGSLLKRYQEITDVSVVDPNNTAELETKIRSLQEQGYKLALTNTTVTGVAIPGLKKFGFNVVSLIHELPRIIQEMQLTDSAKKIAHHSDKIIFPSDVVSKGFIGVTKKCKGDVIIRPQGVYNPIHFNEPERNKVRQQLGLSSTDKLVINVGYADLRKGFDIFVNTARYFAKQDPSVHFLWLGNIALDMQCWIQPTSADKPENFHHIAYAADVIPYFSASDLFFLTSREDPFPSVVLEAFQIGLPVIGLENSGGLCELIGKHGELVDGGDINLISMMIEKIVNGKGTEQADNKKQARIELIQQEFQFDDYCFELLQFLKPHLKKISVVLPNYNYEQYLTNRLWSIFDQNYPLFEIIVLDDYSKDRSLKRINKIITDSRRVVEVEVNDSNSGNVFKQWAKGTYKARGDYIWIAEADDEADNHLCSNLAPSLNKEVSFAYVDSKQMDSKGKITGDSYTFYYDTVAKGDFDNSFVIDGKVFIEKYLSVQNLVLNVSAVIWRKAVLEDCLDKNMNEILKYTLAGDWRLYIEAALRGKVAYSAKALNSHRRHDNAITQSLDKDKHISEVLQIHDDVKNAINVDPSIVDKMNDYRSELEESL